MDVNMDLKTIENYIRQLEVSAQAIFDQNFKMINGKMVFKDDVERYNQLISQRDVVKKLNDFYIENSSLIDRYNQLRENVASMQNANATISREETVSSLSNIPDVAPITLEDAINQNLTIEDVNNIVNNASETTSEKEEDESSIEPATVESEEESQIKIPSFDNQSDWAPISFPESVEKEVKEEEKKEDNITWDPINVELNDKKAEYEASLEKARNLTNELKNNMFRGMESVIVPEELAKESVVTDENVATAEDINEAVNATYTPKNESAYGLKKEDIIQDELANGNNVKAETGFTKDEEIALDSFIGRIPPEEIAVRLGRPLEDILDYMNKKVTPTSTVSKESVNTSVDEESMSMSFDKMSSLINDIEADINNVDNEDAYTAPVNDIPKKEEGTRKKVIKRSKFAWKESKNKKSSSLKGLLSFEKASARSDEYYNICDLMTGFKIDSEDRTAEENNRILDQIDSQIGMLSSIEEKKRLYKKLAKLAKTVERSSRQSQADSFQNIDAIFESLDNANKR